MSKITLTTTVKRDQQHIKFDDNGYDSEHCWATRSCIEEVCAVPYQIVQPSTTNIPSVRGRRIFLNRICRESLRAKSHSEEFTIKKEYEKNADKKDGGGAVSRPKHGFKMLLS